ncbi:hypothetical protein J6590_060346 [Homalodisca vitripennis]|nr:hypothetical protein J6590_060346 [Homalodisca vitripennis]
MNLYCHFHAQSFIKTVKSHFLHDYKEISRRSSLHCPAHGAEDLTDKNAGTVVYELRVDSHFQVQRQNESDKRLAIEMGLLNESMQGLRDAIKRQEHQLSNYINKQGFQDAQLFSKGDFSEESQKFYQTQSNDLENQFGTRLCSAESNISQSSHWSCSLDTINSSIGDLTVVLKSQDKQVIRLITENEELKNEIKKTEKELKKTRFLLKAERETFEQYKKDTFQEVKKHKSEESCETRPNKHFQEMIKLKSELAHYRQMFVEQSHTVNRLSKLVTNLKGDRILLKDKLLQQEKKANKLHLQLAVQQLRSYSHRRLLGSGKSISKDPARTKE